MPTLPDPDAGNPWVTRRFPSPDGTYVFRLDTSEARMSHWIDTPTLLRVDSGAVVCGFVGTAWSLDAARWLDAHRVAMSLRKYPGGHRPPSLEVELDLAAGTATLAGHPPTALATLEAYLDAQQIW